MSIAESIARLQSLIDARESGWAAPPGASERDLERLRDAVAPLLVPHDVEALYRWHDGFELPFLYGYGLQPIDALLRDRPFEIKSLDFPPAWLVLSAQPGGGGDRLFATMGRASDPAYEPIWSSATHDSEVSQMYSSLSAAIETFCDIVEDSDPSKPLAEVGRGRRDELPRSEDDYRLAHSPEAFVWPDPPAGTALGRGVSVDWPALWLESLGTQASALRATGRARPIADLAAAGPAAFPFTVEGLIDRFSRWEFRITDGTGSVWVQNDERTLLRPVIRTRFEIDVIPADRHYLLVAVRHVAP